MNTSVIEEQRDRDIEQPVKDAPKEDHEHFEGVSAEEKGELRFIFDCMDTDGGGTLEWEELAAALESFGEMPSATHLRDSRKKAPSADTTVDGESDAVTFAQFVQVMIATRKRTCVGKVSIFLLLFVLPTLYSMSTRLPFIFLALEVTRPFNTTADPSAGAPGGYGRGGTLLQVSLLLGGYQTCRALANGIIGASSVTDPFRTFFLPQATLAACGWLVSALLEHGGSPWYLFIFCLVGLSETIVTIQVAALKETRNDR